MSSQQQQIKVGFIGPQNSGKSIAAGHLIYSLGHLDKEKIVEFDKKASEVSDDTQKYNFLLNYLHSEYNRNIPFVSPFKFYTTKYEFNIIESEYPTKYSINLIDGTVMHNSSNTDCVVLFVDSSEGNFEKDIKLKGLISEFATITYIFDIQNLIVAINRIDCTNFSQERFEFIQNEIDHLLVKIGFKKEQYKFVPISSLNGDNLIEKSKNTPWWKGGTLIDLLNDVQPSVYKDEVGLRFPVQEVYNGKELGTAVVGRVESGHLKEKQKVVFVPSNIEATVKSIQKHGKEPIKEAKIGESACLFVDVPYSDIKRGFMCGDPLNHPPKQCSKFSAKIAVLSQNSMRNIDVGYECLVKCNAACTQCRMVKIVKRLNNVGENRNSLQKGDTALVVFQPLNPLVVESYEKCQPLARFIVRENKHLIAVGLITDVEFIQ